MSSLLEHRFPHPRDARIVFDEPTHTYSIDGSSVGVTSTTTFIHSFFPHFNADKVLSKMRDKAQKYPGMTDAQIKQMWSDSGKAASKLGTEMHATIENFYNHGCRMDDESETKDGKERKECKDRKEFRMFLQFHREIVEEQKLEPYRTEWSVFDESIRLAGQIDMIYRKPDGTFALYDWKRIKELKLDNRWEKGNGPCGHLEHCNRVHYSLQLNIYRTLLETLYDMRVSEMHLVILHPDNDEYIIYHVGDMSTEVTKLFEHRRKSI